MHEIKRCYSIPRDSFFLFGPRGVGKSTWLKDKLGAEYTINLLKNEEYLQYLSRPQILREKLSGLDPGSWVWIDEVQKVPALLDEVHYLLEEKKLKFALSGSSARKHKRQGANLLAGRAITRKMTSFSFAELKDYDVEQRLLLGCLPLVYNKPDLAKDILRTYVATYLKEEIQEEGHIRKIEPFLRFLEVSASLNGQQINGSNISREAQISRPSIEGYFSILVDTLVGHFLPAYQPKLKVKEQTHPKFYWFDSGVARAASHMMDELPGDEWEGRALETLIFHELRARNYFSNQDRRFYFYRTKSGSEVDFVIELSKGSRSKKPKVILIEVKNSRKWKREWEKPMRNLNLDPKIEVAGMYGIYRGDEVIQKDNLIVFPVTEFFKKLHHGEIF